MKVVLLEQARLPHRALNERLRGGLAVLLQQARLERSGIHTDTDGDACGFRRRSDLADLIVELADVSGVDPHRTDARVDRGEHVPRLKVDIGDHRQLALRRDNVQHIRIILMRDGNTHDVAAGRRQLGYLLQCRIDVRGLRRRHRLHAHLRLAADPDLPDLDLSGLPPRRENSGGFRHSEIDCWHPDSLRRPAGPKARRHPMRVEFAHGTTFPPSAVFA